MVTVWKIDIKKEPFALRDDQYRRDFPVVIRGGMAFPSPPLYLAPMEVRRYEVIKKTYGGETTNYLVPLDQRHLFNDMMELSDHLLEKLILDKTATIEQDARVRILRLSWWRRLLKRF
jgi:hypothetical protein